MANTKRQLLKKKLLSSIIETEKEIARIELFMKESKHADIMTCHTKLSGLQQRLEILTELNHICVERNRY